MARLNFREIGTAVLADLHAVLAAGVELAAAGGIGGRGDAALQDDAVHLVVGVRHRYGGEQGLGVGVQRLGLIKFLKLLSVLEMRVWIHNIILSLLK